jgi:hypothetical protein
VQFHGSGINCRPLISCSSNRDQAGKATFPGLKQQHGQRQSCNHTGAEGRYERDAPQLHAQLDSRGIITIVLGKLIAT